MLKYPCLILDHDDTVVQSESTVNYPCFVDFLKQHRPGSTLTLEQYMTGCNEMTFVEMCRKQFQLSDGEMRTEYQFWKEYIRNHIPAAFPGIKEIIQRQKEEGGLVCVVSMSADEIIRRDYQVHFGIEPDIIFDCELPPQHRKPSPYSIQKIMETYHFHPDQVLVLDDMKFGWQMARAAGVPIAFAAWGRQNFPQLKAEMEKLCDFSFDKTADLASFLFENCSNESDS